MANRLLRRVRDYAQVRADGKITSDVAARALALLEVDEHGFDEVDRRLLRIIIEKFGGGPVGVASLAAAMSEERDALEDIYEPFLIQIGFLDRTPRGRVATARALRILRADSPAKGQIVVNAPVMPFRARSMRPVKIAGLSTYVPPKLLTNEDLEKMVETSNEWILQRTGIRERHIAGEGVATSDLAKEASLGAHGRSGGDGGPARLHRGRHDDARIRFFRAPRACCRTSSVRITPGASTSARPVPGSRTR